MDKNNKRISYITLLQFIGIVLVILGHATRIFYLPGGWYYHQPDISSNLFNALTRIIYTFHMPLFVFLSGYLCERTLSKNASVTNFIQRRFQRLLIPFFACGLLYCVPIWIYLQFPDANYKTFLIGQVMGHLWFLPLLFEITLLYLLLRKIPNRFSFIILFGLISLQFLHFERYDWYAIFRIPEFLSYYYMGAKFYKIEDYKIFSNKVLITATMVITTLTFIFVEYLLYCNNFNGSLRLVLSGIFGVISLVLISKIIVEKYPILANNPKTQFLSLNLLTIFLIHEPILEIILKFIKWGSFYTPVITVLILFVGTIVITLLLVMFVNHITFVIQSIKKRYLC